MRVVPALTNEEREQRRFEERLKSENAQKINQKYDDFQKNKAGNISLEHLSERNRRLHEVGKANPHLSVNFGVAGLPNDHYMR